jgi:hypothetical protein
VLSELDAVVAESAVAPDEATTGPVPDDDALKVVLIFAVYALDPLAASRHVVSEFDLGILVIWRRIVGDALKALRIGRSKLVVEECFLACVAPRALFALLEECVDRRRCTQTLSFLMV